MRKKHQILFNRSSNIVINGYDPNKMGLNEYFKLPREIFPNIFIKCNYLKYNKIKEP
jgi:hypothetical protein